MFSVECIIHTHILYVCVCESERERENSGARISSGRQPHRNGVQPHSNTLCACMNALAKPVRFAEAWNVVSNTHCKK